MENRNPNENYLVKFNFSTGSNPSYGNASKFCHAVQSVPSLFTFNIKDSRIKELPGVAAQVTVTVKTNLHQQDLY
jgi:hypothetical protein